jgi:hypothetical protein
LLEEGQVEEDLWVRVRQSGDGGCRAVMMLFDLFSEKLETSGQLTKTITVGNPNNSFPLSFRSEGERLY